MRLRATDHAAVSISKLGLDIALRAGEEIRTEISAKFRREGVEGELAKAGFDMDSWWTDPQGRFALSLARAR
jgi:L-histidine N-alpha-methyltransferase